MEVLPLVAGISAGLLTMFLVLFAAVTAHFYKIRRPYAHLPTPPGNWFYLGHVPSYALSMMKGEELTEVLLRWSMKVGPIFLVWRLYTPTVVIADPDAVKELSVARTPKPTYWYMQEIFGQRFSGRNLITIPNYEAWKDRRRLFDPAFSISYLQSLVPMFNQVIKKEMIDPMEVHADGKSEIDMVEKFNNTTMQVINWVAFGANFSSDEKMKSIIGDKDLRELLIIAAEGIFIQAQFGGLQYFSPFFAGKYREAARMLRVMGRECIQQRIKALENEEQTPQDLLTLILSIIGKEEDIGLEDLVDEFVTFYAAGQETTSGLLAHSLVALLKRPEIMQSVVEEIDDVLGDKEEISSDDLDKLTFLQQVFEESLRLWPPVPFFGKRATKEITLCGYKIPRKTRIIISSYNLHRSSKYFDDPLKFDPCRFGPGQKRPSPYVYCPFGVGHRMCIGKNFALIEAKVVMAFLLQKYSFQLPDGFEYKQCVRLTLHAKGKIPCRVFRRRKSEGS